MTTKATKMNKKSLKTRILQNKQAYVMMLPVLALLLIFSYADFFLLPDVRHSSCVQGLSAE